LPREVGAGPVGLSGLDEREGTSGSGVELPSTHSDPGGLVAYRNAPLSELGRLRLARVIVEQGWPVARAAERFQVSRPTAHRWAQRCRDQDRRQWLTGPAAPPQPAPDPGTAGRSDRPPALQATTRAGADRPPLGLATSTVPTILVRCRIGRLAQLDRATGQPVRRYEHSQPGALVHIDVKQLGNISAGGGHRLLGRAAGRRNRQADRASGQRSRHHHPLIGQGLSTPPSMTTPGWPMARSTPMRPARPRLGSLAERTPGSLHAAWSSSGS
jgi:hypothetical protein